MLIEINWKSSSNFYEMPKKIMGNPVEISMKYQLKPIGNPVEISMEF